MLTVEESHEDDGLWYVITDSFGIEVARIRDFRVVEIIFAHNNGKSTPPVIADSQ